MTAATIARLAPITAKATAALARKELKASFPGVKFSVRIFDNSRWNVLAIKWENGPTERSVESTLAKFIGVKQSYDLVADMWDIPTHVNNGAGSYYDVSTLNPSREVSTENRAAVELEAMNALGVSTMAAVLEIWKESRREDGSQRVLNLCHEFGVLNVATVHTNFGVFVNTVLHIRTFNA